MRNNLLKNLIFYILIFAFSILIFNILNINVKAESMEDLQIEVSLLKDGSAKFKYSFEFIPKNLATEFYYPIDISAFSAIKDFSVSSIVDNEKRNFTYDSDWDITKTRQEKARKCGIIKKENGIAELVFGFERQEKTRYEMTFTIKNFIYNLKDSSMLKFKFVNQDMQNATPNSVNLVIEKGFDNFNFSSSEVKMWGFGTKGRLKLINGKVVFKNMNFKRNSWLALVLQFEKNIFTGGNTLLINDNFDDIKEQLLKDSEYVQSSKKSSGYGSLMSCLVVFLPLLSVFIKIKPVKNVISNIKNKNSFKDEYYRKIPMKDFSKLYSFIYYCGFGIPKDKILNAFFMKWIYLKKIRPIKNEKEKVEFKIIDTSLDNLENTNEAKIFQLIVEASGENLVLEKNELYKYVEKNDLSKKVNQLFDNIENEGINYLEENGFISKVGRHKYVLTKEGEKLNKEFICFYNYLNDFTLLSEREIQEITIWKELFIYATIYGVSDKIMKHLRELNIDLSKLTNEDIDLDIYDLIIYMNYTNSIISAFNNSMTLNEINGMGGFTSVAGSLSSFGGASGGGSR